jgi:hypothetical protein
MWPELKFPTETPHDPFTAIAQRKSTLDEPSMSATIAPKHFAYDATDF